ncbi:MAG: cyclic nucleotide-binding domain-containing protein [Spirochaetales bacterium]|nr:cyclic nucleotide-binding domain-containing protein [Spirochaetales bacterium]
MPGGIITVVSATGDVYFVNTKGEEIIEPSKDIEVKIKEEFPGMTLRDAVDEAQRYASGAIRKKVEQKRRGHDCMLIVKNIKVDYKIKYGFQGRGDLTKELFYAAGEQIIKKGDRGEEFFWIKEGIVEIDHVEYHPGQVFGRAAFSDGVRKKDAFAKTDTLLIAIDREHPDLVNKIPVILEKFAEEVEQIRKIRPKAKIDAISL